MWNPARAPPGARRGCAGSGKHKTEPSTQVAAPECPQCPLPATPALLRVLNSLPEDLHRLS